MTGMEAFFVVTTIASTAMTVASEIASSNVNSAVAEANAAAEERRAGEERAVAQHQAERRRKEAAALQSQQQARFAASGGGFGGSAADVMAETAGRGEYNSELELWSGEQRARGLEDQSAITRFAAKQQKKALPFKLGATVLTGASKIAGSGVGWGGGGDPYGGWQTTTTQYRYG